MSKRIALKDYISVDGVDISNFVRAVGYTSTDDRVDASGFNSTGASEFLSGSRTSMRSRSTSSWAAAQANRIRSYSRSTVTAPRSTSSGAPTARRASRRRTRSSAAQRSSPSTVRARRVAISR
jgi:hypothetical protein